MESAPPPTIINKEEEYKVEKVWKYRKQDRGMQYLVHQKGYRDEHNQWIMKLGLSHIREVIEDYQSRCLS